VSFITKGVYKLETFSLNRDNIFFKLTKNHFMEIIEIVGSSVRGFFTKFAEFLPNLIGALLILFIGWLIARSIKWGLTKLLTAVKFDDLAARVGLQGFLDKGGIKQTSSGMLASLAYWGIMFIVLITFFNSLGLEVVSDLLNQVVLYIPNIIIAMLLLVVGMYAADFVRTLVVASLRNANFDNAEMVGTIAKGIILFFVASIVLTQLGIGGAIITTVVQGLMFALGAGLAIAFGLGAKDHIAALLDKYIKK